MAKGNIPSALREKQAQARQVTYDKIETAARELREEGREINRRALTEISGLASSTFSKNHVKDYLLRRWGIGADELQNAELASVSLENLDETDLVKKLDDLRKRLMSAENKLEVERTKRKKAEGQLAEGDKEKKILRGELDIAIRKIRVLVGKKPKAEVLHLFATLEGEGRREDS